MTSIISCNANTNQDFAGQAPIIWIIGYSIISKAKAHSLILAGGTTMGLHELIGAEVLWISRPGIKWGEVLPRITEQLQHSIPPDMLVIHCGGNSIGLLTLYDLRIQMFNTVSELATLLPNTLLIWSEILPRTTWRYMFRNIAAEDSRIRLNNAIATHTLNLGGAYIKHQELKKHNKKCSV